MAEVDARLEAIAIRQAELREEGQFYAALLKKKRQSHERRKKGTAAIGVGIAIVSAGLGFFVTPWVGVVLGAAGVGVPWWGEQQDEWDRVVVQMARHHLRRIEMEADLLAREVRRLRTGGEKSE